MCAPALEQFFFIWFAHWYFVLLCFCVLQFSSQSSSYISFLIPQKKRKKKGISSLVDLFQIGFKDIALSVACS